MRSIFFAHSFTNLLPMSPSFSLFNHQNCFKFITPLLSASSKKPQSGHFYCFSLMFFQKYKRLFHRFLRFWFLIQV